MQLQPVKSVHQVMTYMEWNYAQNVIQTIKGIEYSTCIECLPQEQQIKAKEKIAFGKQMQEAHKKLGID